MAKGITGDRGWIFLCNSQTEAECFERNLMGTMQRHLHRLKNLEPGNSVLLYNYESGRLVGHFSATSKARLGIVPEAWRGRFPAQVPVVLEKRFKKPVVRNTLDKIPDLNFDARGYLTNFSVPSEVVMEILDLASGRKRIPGEVASPVERSFRSRFPADLVGSDGHRLRSRGELLIDNWLYTQRPSVPHAYERRLPVTEEVYCDFYVPPANCYLEYWGMDTPEYRARRLKKLDVYEKYDFRLISLDDRDIAELDDRLPTKLLEYLPPTWRFE